MHSQQRSVYEHLKKKLQGIYLMCKHENRNQEVFLQRVSDIAYSEEFQYLSGSGYDANLTGYTSALYYAMYGIDK